MNDAEGYDVLRLIEHSKSCYVSSEYVRGTPLIRWMKYHPNLSKEQLFFWIHDMAGQLERIHKCRGKPCYRYVNPYSMIITEEKELYFLDTSAKSNEKQLQIMRRRSVREHFLPPGEQYYQSESEFLDIYGLGKTMQYLLSVSEPKPGLTRGETARFQKVISKSLNGHSKRAYAKVSEFRKDIPVYRMAERHSIKGRLLLGLLAAVTAAAAIGAGIYRNMVSVSAFPAEPDGMAEDLGAQYLEKNDLGKDEPDNRDKRRADELAKELGFLYFLEKQDYEKAGRYFKEAEETEGLADLSGYMLTEDISGQAENLLILLQEIEKTTPAEDKENYNLCLIEGYRILNSEEAAKNMVRLCEICEKTAGEAIMQKLTAYMAYGYEKTGEMAKAAEKYTELLAWAEGDAAREEIYKKLVYLRQEMGETDAAGAFCRQGLEELKGSVELRLMHIALQCADEGIEREVCAQTVRRYIEEIPEITEEEDFKKLVREYGIVIEGEDIWVGR